jgi:phenolic acid decarboxylase
MLTEEHEMAIEKNIRSLSGKTLRWNFKDGSAKGKSYDHTFNKDGTIDFSSVEGKVVSKPTRAKDGTVVKVADGIFVVSYLGDSGYTLTVVLDFERMRLVGFASNEKEWSQQKGTFKVLDKSA